MPYPKFPQAVFLSFVCLVFISQNAVFAQQNAFPNGRAHASDQFVDDAAINRKLNEIGNRMLANGIGLQGDRLKDERETAPEAIGLELPKLRLPIEPIKYSSKSTLIMSQLYDCGRCNKNHLGCSGAVVISEDGLVLTNYHVIEKERSHNFFAMDSDGNVYPVIEILAANKADDLALLRIDAQGLQPIKIAEQQPEALSNLFVVSHPHGRFFTYTDGKVSRYSVSRAKGEEQRWMEITAVFSQGSSGCGVFDEFGQLIGIVSRKDNIMSRAKDGKGQEWQMTVRKCVPLAAIHEMLKMAE